MCLRLCVSVRLCACVPVWLCVFVCVGAFVRFRLRVYECVDVCAFVRDVWLRVCLFLCVPVFL